MASLFWSSLCLILASEFSLAATHRNVLILFADDGGFQQTAYNNTDCDTPNLDKLAERSVIFRRGYTSVSSCSPSRSVMLTGLPQHQNGMYGLQPFHWQSFGGVKSLPNILSKNGIYTGIIGKYNVAPPEVYQFDYEQIADIEQTGRNITNMKILVRDFLTKAKQKDTPFYLYIGIHDPHRQPFSKYGNFMNNWGDGEGDHGLIPDWKPIKYDPAKLKLPFFLPDTPVVRQDLADFYRTFNRLDQGIGLFMKELENFGFLNDTLVMWTSDNGIPFPNAKTNLNEPGMGEPMMISSPDHRENWGKYTDAFGSIMDFVPTVLDWFKVKFPAYYLNGHKVELTGRSLLPLMINPDSKDFPFVFASFSFHETTNVYPMRVIRNDRYRLIHNIDNRAPYPVAGDIFTSPSFQDILNRTKQHQPTKWFKTLHKYYYRDEWELYDLVNDPMEMKNLAYDSRHADIVKSMKATLAAWLFKTADPWRCMPHSMLLGDKCYPMYNHFNETHKASHSLYSKP